MLLVRAVLPADPLYLTRLQGAPVTLCFAGGVFFGLGVVLLWGLVRGSQKRPYLRAAYLTIFLGGAGRAVSLVRFGAGSEVVVMSALLEMLVPALLLLGQRGWATPRR